MDMKWPDAALYFNRGDGFHSQLRVGQFRREAAFQNSENRNVLADHRDTKSFT